jgi:hypothetical protein
VQVDRRRRILGVGKLPHGDPTQSSDERRIFVAAPTRGSKAM